MLPYIKFTCGKLVIYNLNKFENIDQDNITTKVPGTTDLNFIFLFGNDV